jgi:hypothetical protein
MSPSIVAVTVPLWLMTSQWVLLLALGALVAIAYRQLGYMLRLKDMGSNRDGLPIGGQAVAFAHTPVNHSDGSSHSRFDPYGTWSLLLFADPGCVSCQKAVQALEELAPTLNTLQVLVVTSSDPVVIEAVEEFRTASVPLSRVSWDVPADLYQTHGTPFAYIIDPAGIIRAKGIAGDKTGFQKLLREVDQTRFVAPIAATSGLGKD